MNSDKPYVVIYLSDHGEYVNDEGDQIYGHGFKAISRGEIDIPLVFLFNDEYLKKHRKTADLIRARSNYGASLDNISHTILGLFGVSDSEFYDETYDLSSPALMAHRRYIVDRSMSIYELDQMDLYETGLEEKSRSTITPIAECDDSSS